MIDNEWRRVKEIRIKEKRRVEKEQKLQKIQERRREANRERAIIERKYFVCGKFGHITYYCRNVGEEKSILMLLNRFEVLKNKVM